MSRPLAIAAKYAAISVAIWLFLLAFYVVRFGDMTARRAGLLLVLCALTGCVAWIIEWRRNASVEWFTSFLLYCLCTGAVAVGVVIGVKILK